MNQQIGKNGMPIQVLLVEDSPGDVRLTQEAFREANVTIKEAVLANKKPENLFKRLEA